MSGFMQDVEQDFSGNNNQGQDQQQQSNQGGFSNDVKDLTQDTQSTGGGGGLERTAEDGMVNQEVNTFLNKEDVPVGADGAVDNVVDSEANKFL